MVVVEHEEAIIRAADQVIEIGPGAGERGGRSRLPGHARAKWSKSPDSLTGDYLAGRRGIARQRPPPRAQPRLDPPGRRPGQQPAEHHRRVSAGRAVPGDRRERLGQEHAGRRTRSTRPCAAACARTPPSPTDYDDVFGDGQIDDVIMVDQSPIGRSPRSQSGDVPQGVRRDPRRCSPTRSRPARATTRPAISASTSTAAAARRARATATSQIDMQFLADVYMKCSQCDGTRYRKEILDVTYRGRNIAEVLEMTVREAFTFFRGQPKVQARLKRLIDVGLDYVRLGQPANTLSGGEAQRLKLAAYMSQRQARPLPVHPRRADHRACTSPTSCNCWTASTPCWPSAIR